MVPAVGMAGQADTRGSPSSRRDGARLVVALVALAVIQMLVITLGDSRFASGSDAGGRAAAVVAAVENGNCEHDLGYWASEADPAGNHHPLVNTERSGEAYVQPVDILFVCGASLSSSLLGQPFALVLSVAGVLMAGAGAWLLDRSSGGSGWLALFLVGGVGTVAFYGADVWEHAPAAGAAVLGTALLLTRSGMGAAVIGGTLWGLAIAFRIETGIVALALACVLALTPSLRTPLLKRWPRQAVFSVLVGSVLLFDRWLEQALISSTVRDARIVGDSGGAGQVARAGGELGQRLRDVLVTNIGVIANDVDPQVFLIGALYCASLLVLALDVTGIRFRRLHVGAATTVIVVLALKVVSGGFVPGMFVAAPIAAVGAVSAWRGRPGDGLPVALARAALLALPIVWFFQWTGTLTAQWGGRYQLTSGALLTVAGLSALRSGWERPAARVLVGVAVVVGALGLTWHVERTDDVAEVFAELGEVPCDGVLVSAQRFFLREGGGTEAVQAQKLDDCRLLSADPATVPRALTVARTLGIDRATILYRGQGTIDAGALQPWKVQSTSFDDLGRIPVTILQVQFDG